MRTAIAVGVPAGILAFVPGVQARTRRPQNPPQQKDDETRPPKIDPKLILEANQKEIKKNVEKLYDLAAELKAEVEKTDSVQVLSLAMLNRKTGQRHQVPRKRLNRTPAGECALAPENLTGYNTSVHGSSRL